MNCIRTIKQTPVPSDVFLKTTRLYYEMGRNHYYRELFTKNYEYLSKKIADEDSYAFFKTFFPDFKIKESRLRTLILDSTVPNNKAEQLYKNIIFIFRQIHMTDVEPFHLNIIEINDLVKLLFNDVLKKENLQYRKASQRKRSLLSKESNSMREKLEELIKAFHNLEKENVYEPLILHVNFLVDFINMEIYKFSENHVIGILVFYIVMMQNGIEVSKYESFFRKIYLNKKEYFDALAKTKFQWEEGLAEIMPLERFILKAYTDMYYDLREEARDYEYEENLQISKSDYIENTITKLDEVFSKSEIKEKHPLISDSTINRTLKRLQDENKIRPLGKGRSAKWVKLYKEEKKDFKKQLQLNLGDKKDE